MSRSFWQMWGWPIVLGVLSGTGLVSALVADGWCDWWSWLGLGLPVVVAAWCWWGPRRP
jgi:hypothetical protein